MTTNLTPAARRLLADLQAGIQTAHRYGPASQLVAAGIAVWIEGGRVSLIEIEVQP